MSEVTELIDSYKAGQLTLDELALEFRARRWLHTLPPPPSSYLEMAGRAQDDPRTMVTNSYDEVTAAYARGDISREEYDLLSQAVLDSGKAEDQGL